MTKLK
jgi:hypothetical protein